MPRVARNEVFDPHEMGVYHAFNRTCRRSYLHGVDPLTGVDHSHRRQWFLDRMRFLAGGFAIDVLGFAIMSNHWHCVLRNRPEQVKELSNREVAMRWLAITARKRAKGKKPGKVQEKAIQAILSDKQRIAEIRKRLSDISWFVRLMCQTVARQCNQEDECTGRFFEERFKLDRLESHADVLACMAYVDLNPIRAGMADSLADPSAHVSIGERMRALDGSEVEPHSWLPPLEIAQEVDGQPVAVANQMSLEEVQQRRRETAKNLGCIPMTLEDYTKLLSHLAIESRPELQVHPEWQAEQLRGHCRLNGMCLDWEDMRDRLAELDKRCATRLGQHACRAIREKLAKAQAKQGSKSKTSSAVSLE